MSGSTRTEIRQGVGRTTGDLMLLTATETSATVGTFSDTVHLGDRGDNAPSLVNRILYFSGGTTANLGHEARVSAFQANTRTLSFTPSASEAPADGDVAELWSIADRVGGIDDLHGHINDGIRAVRSLIGVETYDDGATYVPTTLAQLPIPTTWTELGGIEWADSRGNRYDVAPGDHNVIVRPGQRTVELRGRARALATNNTVTLWGFAQPSLLTADDDTTDVDFEWLVARVASALSLAPSWRASDRAAEERRANFWASSAVELRRKVGNARRGWGIKTP